MDKHLEQDAHLRLQLPQLLFISRLLVPQHSRCLYILVHQTILLVNIRPNSSFANHEKDRISYPTDAGHVFQQHPTQVKKA